MNSTDDIAFTDFLLSKAEEARAAGHNPKAFRSMVTSRGGYATASSLLARRTPTEGFTALHLRGRVDLTMEALVVETKWRTFFDPSLVASAELLLSRAAYPFKAFTAPSPSPTNAAAMSPNPATSRKDGLPKRPKNTLSFSKFCAFLGTPLKNVADRWCGYSPTKGIAVFTLWADRFVGDQYFIWDAAARKNDKRQGAKEMRQVLTAVIAAGHRAYGIRCEAKDVNAPTRQREYFDEDQLLHLELATVGLDVHARVVGSVSATAIATGLGGVVVPFQSAIDDLGAPPAGTSSPAMVPKPAGYGYRRDPAVRDYVVRRARGKCEYCGTEGFELPDGTRYVEAHHVIALADEGPDRVDNVIALCAEHHREAHYGLEAETLERSFIETLIKIAERHGSAEKSPVETSAAAARNPC